jgi:deazaflavin-dependent oxidoreductase (nitroreductase family)
VDAGWSGDQARIASPAVELCGSGDLPSLILLTHVHPDHAGSARALARAWAARVLVHPAELPIAHGDFAAMAASAGPLDRWVVLPLMRAAGQRRRDALIARSSLGDVASGVEPDGAIAGLPDWRWIHSPGHTPGHVSLFRAQDRVLLSGDALLTVRVNSPSGVLLGSPGLSGPPRYTTWSWPRAIESIAGLAALEPRVVGPGHGLPAAGRDTPALVADFAGRVAVNGALVNRTAGTAVLGLSGLGYPLTQAAIGRWGRRGAVIDAGVAAGLLARDAALVRSGAPARFQPLPRALLRLELSAAAAATVLGVVAVARPGQRVGRTPAGTLEGLRRLSVGLLFGFHTWRFRVYMSPSSGRQATATGGNGVSGRSAQGLATAGLRPLSAGGRIRLDAGRWLDKHLTPLGVALYRLTGGGVTRLYGVDALLLTTRGRRSRRPRTVVLQFFREGDALLLAAANDGGATNPGWYFNLMANPAARVEVMDRSFVVRAEELTPDEASEAWARVILPRAPTYEAYLRATSRAIPVVRLTPIAVEPRRGRS